MGLKCFERSIQQVGSGLQSDVGTEYPMNDANTADDPEQTSQSTDPEQVSRPADTMRERVGESQLKLWFLISANRWTVTAIILFGTFVLLLGLGRFGPYSIQKLLTSNAVNSVFSSIIIATVTSVTLVLTITQFVLSQELGPLGEQREDMREEITFRKDTEDSVGITVSPAEPARFLSTLVAAVEAEADALRDALDRAGDADAKGVAAVDSFADGIIDHSETVRDQLSETEFGSFEVLLPVLNYNYSWKIFAARNLRAEYADVLPEEAHEILEDLVETLQFFGPAREHFKTLYIQWEVINISRAALYGAMPALAIAGYMILLFDPQALPGTIFGFNIAFLTVSVLYVLVLTPFAVLLAYILRVLTVLKRTLSIGPFVLRETDQLENVQYDDLNEVHYRE